MSGSEFLGIMVTILTRKIFHWRNVSKKKILSFFFPRQDQFVCYRSWWSVCDVRWVRKSSVSDPSPSKDSSSVKVLLTLGKGVYWSEDFSPISLRENGRSLPQGSPDVVSLFTSQGWIPRGKRDEVDSTDRARDGRGRGDGPSLRWCLPTGPESLCPVRRRGLAVVRGGAGGSWGSPRGTVALDSISSVSEAPPRIRVGLGL